MVREGTAKIASWMQRVFKIKRGKLLSCSTGGVSNIQWELIRNQLNKLNDRIQITRYNNYVKTSIITKLIILPYHLATSEIIIVEDIYRPIKYLDRSKGQIIIQTWHALGAFKKFGRALAPNLVRLSNQDPKEIELSHRYTYILDPGIKFRQNYYDSFAPGCKVIEGVFNPRIDLLFDTEYIQMKSQSIFDMFPQLVNKKIILYTPTYRGNSIRSDSSHFINFDQFLDYLTNDYILVLKRHPSMIGSSYQLPSERNMHKFCDISVINVNDLMQISNLMINDYSSTFFEMAILAKPVFFLAKDFDQYDGDRGFYNNFETFVPGPICKDENELYTAIINNKNGAERAREFVINYFGEIPKNNSERFALFIHSLLYKS